MNCLRRDLKRKNKRHSLSRHNQGFSLVELMIALTLSTFLLGALIVTYASGRAASADAQSLSRLQENMRFVSDHLLRDIRNAGFRDQLTLTFQQHREIGMSYAEIDAETDPTELTIRYAGRSHCAQARQTFDPDNPQAELTVVENIYFVEAVNGRNRLRCTGTARGQSNTTDLVDGVAGITYEFIRPTGANPAISTVCNFDTSADLVSACTGVAITVGFVGSIGSDDEREAVLSAAFRNVLVDKIYGRVPEESEEEQGT